MKKTGIFFVLIAISIAGFASCSNSKSNSSKNAAIAYLLTQGSTDYCTGAEITLTSTPQPLVYQLQNGSYWGYMYFTASAGQTLTITSSATTLTKLYSLNDTSIFATGEYCKVKTATSSPTYASSSVATQTAYTASKITYTINTAGTYTLFLIDPTEPPSGDVKASLQ